MDLETLAAAASYVEREDSKNEANARGKSP